MSLDVSKLHNEFLLQHLRYVEHTESPVMFHLWAAIASLSAAMGRHVFVDNGLGPMYANMYVLLVGPPATKKSTAIKLAARLMQESTGVRIAPNDTGGQRQGLIVAIGESDEDEEDEKGGNQAIVDAADLDALARVTVQLGRVEDRCHMFAVASEFGIFIGQNNLDLTRFLISAWDGDNYEYKLSGRRLVLHNPLFGLVGGTTPDDMAMLLPPAAMGSGFTSRIILVYEPTKGKHVPPSAVKLRTELESYFKETYRRIWHEMYGEMEVTRESQDLFDQLYLQDHKIEDTRFIYYVERRDAHLRKLSMCLAAARGSMRVEIQDVYDGELLLRAAERRMPEALGEYGLSPVAVARQKMLEYLRYAGEPISEKVLWAVMQRDMKAVDFRNSLSSLMVADKITQIDAEGHARFYIYNDVKEDVAKLDDATLDQLFGSV